MVTSCRKKTEDVICKDTTLDIYVVGFSWTDIDSGNSMIYIYKQDSMFDILVDSNQISGSVFMKNDTTSLSYVAPGYDYKIVFPAAGRTYLISQIRQTGQTHKVFTYTGAPGSFACYNEVASCLVNGVLYATSDVNTNYPKDVIFLVK